MHFLGLAGMPRRIPDYPDAFAGWNYIASLFSWVTVVSVGLFFYIVYDVFVTKRTFTNWEHELSHQDEQQKTNQTISKFATLGLFTASADAPEAWAMMFQDSASPLFSGIIDLHHDIFFVLIIILALVGWILVRLVVLFKAESKARYTTSPVFSEKESIWIEIIWTILPTILLFIIAIPSFALLYSTEELIDPTITVKVCGKQWYWSYAFSDFDKKVEFDSYLIPEDELEEGQLRLAEVDNRLVLPTNVHIRVLVTASDVMHCFSVPSLGVKIDAIPGRLNQISLFIDRPGVLVGACQEICGIGHAFMPIVIEAVDYPLFLNWILMHDSE